jgi:DNA-binding GntR family transcriptional regulator
MPGAGRATNVSKLDRVMDVIGERLLRELSLAGGRLSADELARRVDASHWVELSTALSELVRNGYVTVVGPLGRAETSYRIHPCGRDELRHTR